MRPSCNAMDAPLFYDHLGFSEAAEDISFGNSSLSLPLKDSQ